MTLGLFVKLALVLVKNPVERYFVLFFRVPPSVPLLNSALVLRDGSADTVGTSVAFSPAPEGEPAEAVAVWNPH